MGVYLRVTKKLTAKNKSLMTVAKPGSHTHQFPRAKNALLSRTHQFWIIKSTLIRDLQNVMNWEKLLFFSFGGLHGSAQRIIRFLICMTH